MDKLDRLRTYLEVVDAGGFAAASRRLGLSRSAVGRAVIQLENDLGAQLLIRSTRKVTPTATGMAFYVRCSAVLHDLDDAMASVADTDQHPTGNLRVNAPMTFGTLYLTPIVNDFLTSHPQVHVELVLNDRPIDPIEEGFDVTVRIGAPPPSDGLFVSEIGVARRLLCAAPRYLAKAGELKHPADLVNHRCLHYGYMETGNAWPLNAKDGSARAFPIGCVMWSNNGQVLADAAVLGQGITLLPEFLVGPAIQQGTLEPVLAEFAPQPSGIYAIHPRHRHLSAKVTQFIELLTERVSGEQAWS